jgi:hypothetical protein
MFIIKSNSYSLDLFKIKVAYMYIDMIYEYQVNYLHKTIQSLTD